MSKQFPNEFKFTPKTWILPIELTDFSNKISKIKPSDKSQGKGIFLIKKFEDLSQQLTQLSQNGESPFQNQTYVAQKYVDNPLLFDNLKFDLRIYVLLAGANPLKIFIHQQGLCRLATEQYQKISSKNSQTQFMHLTNYAINKKNQNFLLNTGEERDDQGHKRSLQAVWKYLESKGHNVRKIQKQINHIVIKTLCTIQPGIAHVYKSSQPDDITNAMCFEILGFDILIDDKQKA